WQHPYVNIFKHVRIEDWKRSAKEGDVSSCTSKALKCSVFHIRGPVPANSYILIPKNSNQSLALTGRYIYLLFRPTPGKYFVVHLDVSAEEGQVVRISFSNMFKEFKSTATWLQFPFLCGAAKDSVYESSAKSARHLVGPAPSSVQWTCLMLDLQYTLSVYLDCRYSNLKSIKLCANMAVKNMFTSDLLLDPVSFSEAKLMGLSSSDGTGPIPREMSFPVPKGGSWHDVYEYIRKESCSVNLSKPVQDRVSLIQQITTPKSAGDEGVHVYVHAEDVCSAHREESEEEKLLPDPILRLNRVIGFGGATTKCGDAVVYPCHAIIISMMISSNQQRFFIGHTDKVSALAFDGNTTILASAQSGNHSVVRVWNYHKGNCLAMFRTHAHSFSSLFSYSGSILCGVGKDRHNKNMVVVWSTLNVSKGGEVTTLAKAHTDVDINTIKVAFFDETMVSCGRDNIRLWRVRNGTLRSCPVSLGECHSMDFTDVAFEEGSHNLDERTFASSRSGHIFEIDYSRVVIRNVRRLLPAQQQHSNRREKLTFNNPGIAINSISVSSSFCATGSEDGFLRLWPLDFSAVFLEAHEGPVSLVSVSSDSLQVLAATSSGNLGFLDVRGRGYSTLMRSHTDSVLGFSLDGLRRHLTTASSDGTVRIWNMDSLQQLYDFVSEDSPCSVAFHPSEQVFICGFSSGIVRVFDISSAKLLAEHQHRGEIVGLAFSPDGEFMYSADSQGSLALYNASEEEHDVIRVANVVARGTERAPDALTVSSDSRCLAFVGPSEYIITIADSRSLDELLLVDVSILDVDSPRVDSALKVRFSPASTEHLLVAISSNKILWVSTKTGRLLREVSKVHKHECSSLAVSEDARFLLTAGHNAVKVWDYNMLLDINSQMFIGHSQPIRQVSFTPDQLGVVSVGDAIFLWDFLAHPADPLADSSPLRMSSISVPKSQPEAKESTVQMSNGMPRQTAPLPSSLAAVAPLKGQEGIQLKAVIGYNGNGRGNMVWSPEQLFAYSCSCLVVVEYLHTGSQRHLQGHSEEISCLTFTNDAQTLASAAGGSNGTRSVIRIWDLPNGTCHKTISYHKGAVQSLAFSTNDRFFISVRVRAPVEMGDVELTALCYHMDSFLFTATNHGHVCVWDVTTQRCFMTWEADEGEIVLLCRGNRLLTGSNTCWLRLWEVVLKQEIMLDGTVVSAAFDNTMDMGIVGTTAGTLWYINWCDNTNTRLVSGHKNKFQVNDVVFSSDERHFATCSEDGSVRVWSALSNELVVQFQVLNQACGCICWSPSCNKDSMCVAAGYSDGTLRIFRLASSEMAMKLQPHNVAVTAVQYSANGKNGLVVVSSPVNGATVRVIRDHKGATITSIQCCKDFGLEGIEMWLAATDDRRVSVWAADWMKDKCDLLDWLTFPADDSPPPSLAAFCPTDPSLVVYTGYGVEKELSFYSLAKKQIIKKIALPHWATCFSLSCKSQLIAVGSKRVLKLIESTGGRFQDFVQHSDSLQSCHFSPSGSLLFTVAYNEILLWEVKGL
uniref:WD repeat domain 90 n=1 Tax=Labrus bergylta TaxID=56723 RepID=A0A3Q3FLA8_9LABR